MPRISDAFIVPGVAELSQIKLVKNRKAEAAKAAREKAEAERAAKQEAAEQRKREKAKLLLADAKAAWVQARVLQPCRAS